MMYPQWVCTKQHILRYQKVLIRTFFTFAAPGWINLKTMRSPNMAMSPVIRKALTMIAIAVDVLIISNSIEHATTIHMYSAQDNPVGHFV